MQSRDQFDQEHFRRAWPMGDFFRLRQYTPGEVESLGMPERHVAVLTDVGIPEEAAPFLAFDDPQLPCPLETWALSDVFVEDVDRFVVIGSDGSGNPVVLDRTRPGFVLLIDRERGTGIHVFNTSIPRFLSSLLAFRDFVDLRNQESSPAVALAALAERLEGIDPEAWEVGSLWLAEIEAQAGLLAG
ncbi:SUKH-4 family immunity protein [Streptomyces sp. VRA16 Mangrove soil]|uniref:SUKH-4 family immunity protein n=1 Tax=Streptomyces sp. VRA16 Mangrove soil TaxID=2817434 RepID=UPI001A9FA360|nr:SUKH-4 family immunity protein [Streptomyces sp. VRA16 Mangrove soil]MBO1332559.1 SUKH-4 family immunity protein [Streptomyces sp. VRA16 Mangrove soil]